MIITEFLVSFAGLRDLWIVECTRFPNQVESEHRNSRGHFSNDASSDESECVAGEESYVILPFQGTAAARKVTQDGFDEYLQGFAGIGP